ncbi:hypothetical protein ABFA25_00480 [Mycobacterium lepromatosis]|nr:hypothetical protein [Mycobacterium lepromatosis]
MPYLRAAGRWTASRPEILGADDNHVDLASVSFWGESWSNLPILSLGSTGSAVVNELRRDITVSVIQHRDNDLQVVAPFAVDANLVALHLGLDGL